MTSLLTRVQPGDRIQVIRAFEDFDGEAWAPGEILEYRDYSYVPYDGGFTFRFAGRELRLAYGSNDPVLKNPEEYFSRV